MAGAGKMSASTTIRKESLYFDSDETGSRTVLSGEIDDLCLTCFGVAHGDSMTLPARDKHGRAIIFLAGKPEVRTASGAVFVPGLAFYSPTYGEAVTVTARSERAILVGLDVAFDDDETRIMSDNKDGFFPWLVDYGHCPTYSEEFKSEKTISRTLLPHDRFPRLCVGSVETEGPDEVGAHSHPMLEQVFIGLPQNNCKVVADGVEANLGEMEALHIPLGSHHGASVESGQHLHYIWIDLFLKGENMDWVSQGHIPDP